MAKTNNLTDFLTDVANAIREKEGSSEAINPQAFSSRILALQTGGSGGGGHVPAKDVNFRDYDGTILHSYSKDAFLAISEMPELPTMEGLVCQGWNWSHEDAKSYVEKYGILEVGAMYITDDGKTRLYVTIDEEDLNNKVSLSYAQSVANGVVINWGDGSSEESLAASSVTVEHTYPAPGDYRITLEVISGNLGLGRTTGTKYNVMGQGSNAASRIYSNRLRKVELGSSVKIDGQAFLCCTYLTSVTMPRVSYLGDNSFYYCHRLKFLTVPDSASYIGEYIFQNNRQLTAVSLTKAVKVNSYPFYGCTSLQVICLPETQTAVPTQFTYACDLFKSVVLPDSITSMSSQCFYNNFSMTKIFIPKGVTSIQATAFSNCYGMQYYDFSKHESVPSLANKNAFNGIPSDCKIIVPDALYEDWKVATNWSTYASNIIKKSDWDSRLN